jgi:hypothetical protein
MSGRTTTKPVKKTLSKRFIGKAEEKGGSALQGDWIGQLADTVDLDGHLIPRL